MRADVDFESYAAARWHLVVRSLVLLGVPPGRAATLSRQALAQLRSEWSHQDAFDDLDVELYREVLELKHRDDAAWWAEPPFDEELWSEIEPELDRLSTPQREWLVLRDVAELPESHIAAVVGLPETGGRDPVARSGVPNGERMRDVARVVPVQPPDLEQVVAAAEGLRRRRRRRGIAGAAALLGAAGVAALVVAVTAPDEGSGEPDRELSRVSVERATSLAAVGWYADGRLHLSNAVLDLPDLRDAATINDGAVYTDDQGDLVQVNDQGQRTLLASLGDQGSFVVSDEDGLVAWLAGGEDSTLVVRDLTARSDVARVELEGAGEVIAIDSPYVYFRDDRGDQELSIVSGDVEEEGTDSLLDVSSRVRVLQDTPSSIAVVGGLLDAVYTWPGERAQLSEDGRQVLTWVGDEVRIHETLTGDAVPVDLAPNSLVLDAEFGADGTITYLASQRRSSSGIIDVRSCSIGNRYVPEGECTQEVAGVYRGLDTDFRLAR